MSKFYLIGNAHIDPVWLWNWQSGYSEVLATFRSALDRMKEYDDFKFTSACAVYYEWVEKTNPDMFKEIVQRVKEGRWNIAGGWYLQPDCNIPSGESFARHALVSQRYFKEKFGIIAKTGYNIDSFGHNGSLPKILKECGLDNYIFMRPDKNEKTLDKEYFLWQSDDGSIVKAYRCPMPYCITLPRMHALNEYYQNFVNSGESAMAFYGVGNHGGGPTKAIIDAIKSANYKDTCFATLEEYFDNADYSNAPTVKGELLHHARGCYSVNSFVKTQNRLCEDSLIAAESFAVMANKLVGRKYPAKKFKKAWKNVLFNQFHDILAGCSLKSAYTDASYLYGEVMSIAEQEINFSLQAISNKIDTGAPSSEMYKTTTWQWETMHVGTPIILFNPHPYEVKRKVTLQFYAPKITDDEGNIIPSQKAIPEFVDCGALYLSSFIATVPAMGYKVYRAFTDEKTGETNGESEVVVENNYISNGIISVYFDMVSGEISKIINEKTGETIANGNFSAVFLDETDCDTWAHNKRDLGKVCGTFTNAEFEVLEKGVVYSTLRVTSKCNDSTLIRDYTLEKGDDAIYVKGELITYEKHKAFKLCFPAKNSVKAAIPFGVVERGLNDGEQPFAKWFASNNLLVINDGRYGYDSLDDSVRMTVSRTAVYADHYGTRRKMMYYMEQGTSTFKYAICPFKDNVDAFKRADEFVSPIRAVTDTFHSGKLPTEFSGAKVDGNVVFSAIKKCETTNDALIRYYEVSGKDVNGSVELFGKKIPLNAKPYQIKTVTEKGIETDFTEMNLE